MVSEDLIQQLFVKKSLKNNENGFQLQMNNSISDATIIEPIKLEIKGESVEKEKYKDFTIDISGKKVKNKDINVQNPAQFNVKSSATLYFKRDKPLPKEKYKIRFTKLLTE
ncbi:MAG: hypothetical protein ACXAC8_18865, partial [Candidatus Hodarchaeales archaeon]